MEFFWMICLSLNKLRGVQVLKAKLGCIKIFKSIFEPTLFRGNAKPEVLRISEKGFYKADEKAK